MGSRSDYAVMRSAVEVLREFDVPFEARVVSAHRTPERMVEYAQSAVARGLRCIIAGAGGAAHLPGMIAALDGGAGAGRAGRGDGVAGLGRALEHCADAEGCAGGNPGHRRVGRGQCGSAGAIAMLATTDTALQQRLMARRAAARDAVLAETLDDDGGLR